MTLLELLLPNGTLQQPREARPLDLLVMRLRKMVASAR